MRFVYGAFAFFIWVGFAYLIEKGEDVPLVSSDMWLLSTAIIVAGVMAGGG